MVKPQTLAEIKADIAFHRRDARLNLFLSGVAIGLLVAFALFLLAGCAMAAAPGEAPDAGGVAQTPDAAAPTLDAPARPLDAPIATPDAPATPTTIALTQTSTTALAASSLGCQNGNSTASQAYYRVFDLAALGITGPFTVSSVTFGVQQAAGTQTVSARVGSYSATPGATLNVGSSDWAGGDVTALGSASVSIPATDTGELVTAPLATTIPAGGSLIVEIFSPSHTSASDTYFFLGASSGTETTPGFFWAPSCDANPPGTPAELGESPAAFQITVMGSY